MQFKDITLMTIKNMKDEYISYFNKYQKIISMPADVLQRINILMAEIKRKELYEAKELAKSEYQKAFEESKLSESEEFKEEMALRTELGKLNINFMRDKYLNNGRKFKK